MLNDNTHKTPLRTICLVRWVMLACWLSGMIACWYLDIALPLKPLFWILSGVAIINVAASKITGSSKLYLALWLAFDIAWLTTALYFVGGAENPFISLLLLPVAFSIISLPRSLAITMTAAAVGCYTGLMVWNQPWNAMHHNFQLHVWGMWANFIFTVAVLITFLAALNRALQTKTQQLAEAREQALRDQHIMSFAALAAGAAHELNTPLSTLNMLNDELAASGEQTDLSQQIQLQIQRCQRQVALLKQKADSSQQSNIIAAKDFLTETINHWAVTRPNIAVKFSNIEAASFESSQALTQGLFNLLDNAADASSAAGQTSIEVSGCKQFHNYQIIIQDFGSGIEKQILPQLGKNPVTSKPNHIGMGVLLATNAIEVLAGQLSFNSSNTGTQTIVRLPLK